MDWNGWIYLRWPFIYYCGQESLRRNGIAIIVNKRVWNAVLGYSLTNDRMISVYFQGKPFNITVIQVYAPTSNTEAEVELFYEDLQDILELTPKKDVLFIIGGWNAKVGSQETPGVTAGSQREESHPWQGHAAEVLMGKVNQASGFPPGISWACTPPRK